MNLILINYSMHSKSALFSHQREIAISLSKHFEKTFVITQHNDFDLAPEGISISSTNWRRGENLRNVIRFYSKVLPIIFRYRKTSVAFCHMTDVQSFLIAGICKLLRVNHYLWYAHKSLSIYLKLAYPFLAGIFTSTAGSCPLKGEKVHPVGQAVKVDLQVQSSGLVNEVPISWYHIGRLDPSKKIEDIILALDSFRQKFPRINLHIYGAASSEETESYANRLRVRFSSGTFPQWLTFHGGISHSQLSEVSLRHDGFIHAFQGSLDKALVEAVMLRRLVVSANPEFSFEFEGIDTAPVENVQTILKSKLEDMFLQKPESRAELINRNYGIAFSKHSMESWVQKVVAQIEDEYI